MTTTAAPTTGYRVARWVGIPVFVVSAVLLTSIGGAAIFASPVTVPALWVIAYAHPTRPFRYVGSTIAGLTVAEVSLIVPYVLFGLGRTEPTLPGEPTVSQPAYETVLALGIMAVCAVGTIWAYLWSTQPDRTASGLPR
jgi:hypothetical protein